ncbi:MAG: alpha/beta fold hydrolase [Elusimicrobia bacterium]|nr:alpha/beta fold hydrolase [Elusimicrobiota bacterium]
MILASVVAVAAAAFVYACWYGSEIVFHPPKMLANTVFPEQFGLKAEPLALSTADGVPLAGWLIPAAAPTDRSLLLFHGWGDNKGDLLERTHFLSRKFNLVYLDTRAHGESGGAFSTIGCRESRDVEAVVAWLQKERPRWTSSIGLFGLSMGGALALWAAAKWPFFRCAAVEAPFPSFNRVVGRYTYNGYRLPYFPFAWAALRMIRLRLGEDPEPYSPIYHVDKISPRPLLFIAGELDTLMPLDDVRELYERAGRPKDLWVIDGAAHGKCWKTAGQSYRDRLLEFYDRNLPA